MSLIKTDYGYRSILKASFQNKYNAKRDSSATQPVQTGVVEQFLDGMLPAPQRIKARCGAGKGIIATVRMLLSITDDTLKNGWMFEDLAQFKIKEKQRPAKQPS